MGATTSYAIQRTRMAAAWLCLQFCIHMALSWDDRVAVCGAYCSRSSSLSPPVRRQVFFRVVQVSSYDGRSSFGVREILKITLHAYVSVYPVLSCTTWPSLARLHLIAADLPRGNARKNAGGSWKPKVRDRRAVRHTGGRYP